MTNSEIVDSFLDRQPATGPASTNGEEIRSYGKVVARWTDDGIVMPGGVNSGVSSRCRNLVRQRASKMGIKVVQN